MSFLGSGFDGVVEAGDAEGVAGPGGVGEAGVFDELDHAGWAGKTLEQVLDVLVTNLQAEYEVTRTVDKKLEALPGERVFQKGFDPLAGGVRFDADPLSIFDQWVEVLPTDQVVAVEYQAG